ncbi:MAG: RNase adapter RapZ [Brachymonas sp.]|nr:RNase adapter RapZ [Brachymonas sp.]
MSAPDRSSIPSSPLRDLRLVMISGMSGAGKSVALHALEDAGYYCVDNLPPALLLPLLRDLGENLPSTRIAISMDARSSPGALSLVPQQVELLREHGVEVIQLFLDASNEIIMRRYSETRRKHPLTRITSNDQDKDLLAAIQQERLLLAPLREHAHVIDTTMTRAAQLRTQVKELLTISNQRQLTLVLESFAFKRGVPTDADYVFDVRMLPNPHYEQHLRPLTGRDQPVANFLLEQPKVMQMQAHIRDFLRHWLPELANDHRSYVTVAIGCTGGQHRSVFLVEQLYRDFNQDWVCLKRHREMELARV